MEDLNLASSIQHPASCFLAVVFRFSGFPVFRFSGFPVFRFKLLNCYAVILLNYYTINVVIPLYSFET